MMRFILATIFLPILVQPVRTQKLDTKTIWGPVLTLENVAATDEDAGHLKHTMYEEVTHDLEKLGGKPS